MDPIPAPPRIPAGQHQAAFPLRYSDVREDGTIGLEPLGHALGAVAWPAVLSAPEARALSGVGIYPILYRLVLERFDTPISATVPLRGQATWHRWTARRGDGEVERIVLSMWVDLDGTPGSTFGGATGAPSAPVGRVYAEHALTRLFAGPGERRVLALPDGTTPAATGASRPFDAVGPEAPALEGRADSVPAALRAVRFGRVHTDSNGHVNSLVYVRLFEEACAEEAPTRAFRRCEVAWRKPFFTGDGATIRRWTASDGGVAGAYVDEGDAVRCRIHLTP